MNNLWLLAGLVITVIKSVMPNTHRRRRRDSTVELSRVGVASASAVCIGLKMHTVGGIVACDIFLMGEGVAMCDSL